MSKKYSRLVRYLFSIGLTIVLLFNSTTLSLALVTGQIMVDATNQKWHVYNRDVNGDGKKDPHYMCAPGDPEDFLYRNDQTTLINKLIDNKANGKPANGIYMQIVRSHGGDGTQTHNPFVSNDPTKGLNQSVLDKWEEWFTLMDNNEITIYLFFFDDSAKITNWGSYSLNQFITDIVNKFEHHKHLIWVVAEEYQEKWSSAEVKSIAATIRNADNNDHPIAVHKLSGLTFSEFADDPNIDQFSIQNKKSDLASNHSSIITAWNNANGKYNLNLSEPQNITPSSSNRTFFRQRNWAVGMAGASIMNIEWTIANTPADHLKDCGRMVSFMESTNFNEMAPNDNLKAGNTQYVLAKPGDSYIAYASAASSALGLTSMTAGTYTLKWIDTISGQIITETKTLGSGTQTFAKPANFGSEVAVYLKRQGSGPVPTPTPSPSPSVFPSASLINKPPVAQDTTVTTNINTSVYIQLAFEDPDGPGPYTYTITKSPANGRLTGSDNDRTYTPNTNFVGTDSFKWLVNDGLVNSATATVTINVIDNPADADGDGDTDVDDFKIWIGNYAKLLSGKINGDFMVNTKVNAMDFALWRKYSHVASPSPSVNPSVTPLPGSGTGLAPVQIGTGAYPDVAVDNLGNVHVVWASGGKLVYKKYTAATGTWSAEQDTGLPQNSSYRNDPDIVIDSQNRPHVIGGTGNGGGKYAYWNGSSWVAVGSFNRDTAIAIDKNDNVYVSERGTSSQYIRVYKKTPTGTSFTPLNHPVVTAENDHVYTDIAASLVDNSLHIVYRHATVSSKCSAVSSTDGGNSWNITGISSDDTEAPSVTVAKNGKVYAACGNGNAFEKSGSSWIALGKAVTAGSRKLPIVSTDSNNNLYASTFGGRYNVRVGTSWVGEKILSGMSTKAKGFVRIAGSPITPFAYLAWEEGNSNAENDSTVSTFDIIVASVNTSGVIGSK